MIQPFEWYLKLGKAKKKTPDTEEAHALLTKAQKRVNYIERQTLTSDSAQFIFEDTYEALREASQSFMSIHGYKPYSHEATISFLHECQSKTDTTSQ